MLGGECTVTLAVLAAYADAGLDLGLVYVDGGQDLQLPADHPEEPIADSMGVAHLLDLPGAHDALAGLGPRRPLLTADRLCFVGYADDEEDVHGLVPSARIPAATVLADPAAAARQAVAAVGTAADGFLVHLDVDVLDMFTLPLADIPQYGRGLTPPVLRDLLAGLLADPRWSGLVVTEANPDRDDEHGTWMSALVDLLGSALAPADVTGPDRPGRATSWSRDPRSRPARHDVRRERRTDRPPPHRATACAPGCATSAPSWRRALGCGRARGRCCSSSRCSPSPVGTPPAGPP